MPPVNGGDLRSQIEDYIKSHKVMIFSKSTCPFCAKVKDLFKTRKVTYYALELDEIESGTDIQNALLEMTGQKTVPNVFISEQHLGGWDNTLAADKDGSLTEMLAKEEPHEYDYDLIVMGGGSGGLAASKEAAEYGKKVAVLDFVKPSPQGTKWGLGGTCVNVGCIPKKLMHQAALLGQSLNDARPYGWEIDENVHHNWKTLVENVQNHIGSLNWNYRVELRNKSIKYLNSYGEFIDNHTIKATDKKGKVTELTSNHFLVATGMRPKYPDWPGAKEYCITSDDLFSLPYHPGKTLVIGGSYVALECAGFLAGIGCDVTVSIRSILLRGFDQQMAEKIGEYMEKHGINFLRPCVPYKFEQIEEGEPGTIRVYSKFQDGKEITKDYNTVIIATGRNACTTEIGLDKIGVKLHPSNMQILSENEHTNIANVHAVGDVLHGKPELTPMAIQAGRLLARRLFAGTSQQTDYVNVPTTVFTPLEYGCIGYSEEDANDRFGNENIEVYHSNFMPLEWTVPGRDENACYVKLICVKPQNEKVVGFHVLGPNAGEITQGFALAMKLGATKADFDATIGIHPTCAEVATSLATTKSSGKDVEQAGC